MRFVCHIENLGAGSLEFGSDSWKPVFQDTAASRQERVEMARLWHAGAPLKVAGNDVALENRHTVECFAQDARSEHPSHTPANHDGAVQ